MEEGEIWVGLSRYGGINPPRGGSRFQAIGDGGFDRF